MTAGHPAGSDHVPDAPADNHPDGRRSRGASCSCAPPPGVRTQRINLNATDPREAGLVPSQAQLKLGSAG